MVAAMIKFYKIALSNSQKSMANVKKKCWSELNFKEREREREKQHSIASAKARVPISRGNDLH